MPRLKLNSELVRAIGNWVEDTLANVDCSIEHEATVSHLVIGDNKAWIPFRYKASNVDVRGVLRFSNMDYLAETICGKAAECGDGDLLKEMISIAKAEESIEFLQSLQEEFHL